MSVFKVGGNPRHLFILSTYAYLLGHRLKNIFHHKNVNKRLKHARIDQRCVYTHNKSYVMHGVAGTRGSKRNAHKLKNWNGDKLLFLNEKSIINLLNLIECTHDPFTK